MNAVIKYRMVSFSDAELATIDRALSIAATAYELDAVRQTVVGQTGVADTLRNEASVCRELADKIGNAMLPVTGLEWSRLRYPCDDPEQGPARRNPVKGCIQCGDLNADSYTPEGVCQMCADPVEHESYCPALQAPENPCSCDADGTMFPEADGDAAERAAIESDREAGLVP